MAQITAVLSMLHEPALPNSATRLFRQEPVLAWTLQRLKMTAGLSAIAIVCWDDQLEDVAPIGADAEAYVLAKGPRKCVPAIETVAAARRWADGWRGGLLSTCDFDRGFWAPAIREVAEKLSADAIMLVDPSAGLVDPKLIDQIIHHASTRENVELFFTQAAPGLGGAMLRRTLVDRLASANTHPGRLLNYLPESPMRDPISGEGCVPVPTQIARTSRHFRLDSDRQIQKIFEAAIDLNGELARSDAEDLLRRLQWSPAVDSMPRELVLELGVKRATSPIFSPGRFEKIERAEMNLDLAAKIFEQFAAADDARLTFAGVGDPLLHPQFFEMVELARQADISAIHVETDLLPTDPAVIEKLAASAVDVVSVHLPAMTHETYSAVMGVDRFADVIQNIQAFVVARQRRGAGVPLMAPIFTKCQINLGEMDAWYDQWLKALGSVIVNEPTSCGGMVPACGVADMSPPKRRPCARIASRMTVLSNGLVPSCEQDVLARQALGDLLSYTIEEIWTDGFSALREAHATGQFAQRPVCIGCKEWHRP